MRHTGYFPACLLFHRTEIKHKKMDRNSVIRMCSTKKYVMCKIAPQFWCENLVIFYDFIYQTTVFRSNFQVAVTMKNLASLEHNLFPIPFKG